MELIDLGATGEKVPVVGLGTWQYTGGPAPLRRGVELGAFLIDTAEMYHTEVAVARAVEGIRDQVFIATKVLGSTLRYDQVLSAADRSLKRLNVDCIDLYQVHWPNSAVPIAETMGAIERLVDEGKVRYVGVSNFSVAELKEAQAAIKHPIVSNQVLYSLTEREIERELLPYCQRNGVTVMAYSPLAEGALARPPRADDDGSLHVLRDVAEEVGKTMAQVALNWCIARDSVMVIPKSDSVARTEENCAAAGWRLTPEQMRRLDTAFAA